MVGFNLLSFSLFILVLLSCAESKKCCKDPDANCGEKLISGGIKYICTKKNGWVPYGCPKIVQVDGVPYRFLAKRPTPCVGDINQCVYLLGWQEFCMNGDFPNVTPLPLPIEPYNEDLSEEFTPPVTTYVTTYLGTNKGPDSFDMDTADQPVYKYTFYESKIPLQITKVCGGFKWSNSNQVEQPSIGNVDTDILGSVDINLGSTDFITSVY